MMAAKEWLRRRRLYLNYQKKVRELMDLSLSGQGDPGRGDSEGFIRIQLCWIGGGLLFLLLFFLILAGRGLRKAPDLVWQRNAFGEGDKELSVILDDGEEEETFSFSLGEEMLTGEEEDQLYDQLFLKLPSVMKGDNSSLSEVRQDLYFPDSIEGYPFRLGWQVEDPDLIAVDGSLTEGIKEERKKALYSRVTVTAQYGNISRSKDYDLVFPAVEAGEEKSRLAQAEEMLLAKEKADRTKGSLTIPSKWKGVSIRTSRDSSAGLGFLCFLVIGALIPVWRHSALQEKAKACQESAQEDFSLIVHLLVIFMNAGLSFPSALSRISRDYREGKYHKEKRYAFEQLLWMEKQLMAGSGQREILKSFGKRFSCQSYQRLSLILAQSLSRGQKEAEAMMEAEERRAFAERIDQAQKAGEKARTKLLFPMALLLALTMFIVMFPALVRFYRY